MVQEQEPIPIWRTAPVPVIKARDFLESLICDYNTLEHTTFIAQSYAKTRKFQSIGPTDQPYNTSPTHEF